MKTDDDRLSSLTNFIDLAIIFHNSNNKEYDKLIDSFVEADKPYIIYYYQSKDILTIIKTKLKWAKRCIKAIMTSK